MSAPKNKTVFVGLSGGVDSSVAALRLKKAGYNVVGVFIKVWHPDFLVCNWEAERLDAMRVAAHLDIPFLTCDAEDAYKKEVADYFISEYKNGRTPNPDVFCNKAVKFGVFLDFAKKKGADYIATGHYAQNISFDNEYHLIRGLDAKKDQTYFLWTLTQEQLDFTLLPIGSSTKDKVRQEAKKAKIPTAAKKDSQGICFLGHVDIPKFLAHFVDLQIGNVVSESGEVIGKHQDALVYTVGQRHGFVVDTKNVSTTPHYVVDRNLETNEVVVSPKPPFMHTGDIVCIKNTNWIGASPETNKTYQAQFYYQQKPLTVKLVKHTHDSTNIQIIGQTKKTASGQSCVLYDEDRCMGGGIIV